MFLKFDTKTKNILKPIIQDNKLIFISITNEIYESDNDDTLIYSETLKESSFNQFENLIKNILIDPTNPKIIDYCNYCKNKQLIAMVEVKNDIINQCFKCKNQWIKGINNTSNKDKI